MSTIQALHVVAVPLIMREQLAECRVDVAVAKRGRYGILSRFSRYSADAISCLGLGVREPQAFEISVGTDPTALAVYAGELVCLWCPS